MCSILSRSVGAPSGSWSRCSYLRKSYFLRSNPKVVSDFKNRCSLFRISKHVLAHIWVLQRITSNLSRPRSRGGSTLGTAHPHPRGFRQGDAQRSQSKDETPLSLQFLHNRSDAQWTLLSTMQDVLSIGRLRKIRCNITGSMIALHSSHSTILTVPRTSPSVCHDNHLPPIRHCLHE